MKHIIIFIVLAAALLAFTPVANAQTTDRIFGILQNTDTNTSSLIQVDTDGVSITTQTLVDIPGTGFNQYARNSLAYVPGLDWLVFTDKTSTTTFDVYRYELSTGTLALGLSNVTYPGGELAAGAWNSNPSLFNGIGYYISARTPTGAELYFLDGGLPEITATTSITSPTGGAIGWGDFEFTTNGIVVAGGETSTTPPGVFFIDNDLNASFLSNTYPGQIAYSGNNWYSIGAGDGAENGVILSLVDPLMGTASVIGSAIPTGNYVVNDIAGTHVTTVVPEPSSALLLGLTGLLAVLRRRR